MSIAQAKKVVVGVAIVSLIIYLIMASLTNGESLANPNGIQLAVEILVIISFFTAAILEKKSPAPPAAPAPPPAPAAPSAPPSQKKGR